MAQPGHLVLEIVTVASGTKQRVAKAFTMWELSAEIAKPDAVQLSIFEVIETDAVLAGFMRPNAILVKSLGDPLRIWEGREKEAKKLT